MRFLAVVLQIGTFSKVLLRGCDCLKPMHSAPMRGQSDKTVLNWPILSSPTRSGERTSWEDALCSPCSDLLVGGNILRAYSGRPERLEGPCGGLAESSQLVLRSPRVAHGFLFFPNPARSASSASGFCAFWNQQLLSATSCIVWCFEHTAGFRAKKRYVVWEASDAVSYENSLI